VCNQPQHPFLADIDWDNLISTKAPIIPDLKSDTDTQYFPDVEPDDTEAQRPNTITQQAFVGYACV
jgi:protein-serine/threonine kinase